MTDPTPEQIAERAAEIRAGWTASVAAQRWGAILAIDNSRLSGIELRMVRVIDLENRSRKYGRGSRPKFQP